MVRTLMRPDSMPGAYGMAVTRNGLLLVAGYTATVGSEPVGLLLVDDGRLALVCNSNRALDLAPGTGSDVPHTVSVITTAAAFAHRSALVGAVPAGLFPRDLALDQATGQVMLGNFNSGTVEEFPVPAAP